MRRTCFHWLAFLPLLIALPSFAAAGYFRAPPDGWTEQKLEDHYRLDIGADSDWVSIIVLPAIQTRTNFSTWFNTEVPRMTDGVFGVASSRGSVVRLNWRPAAKATLSFDSFHESNGQDLTVNVIGYDTNDGRQIFFTMFPATVASNDQRVRNAFTYIQKLRDEAFSLTLDMLRPEPAAAPAGSISGARPSSGAGGCTNYQTGSYNTYDTRCTNTGCTTTTTPVPLYSRVCK